MSHTYAQNTLHLVFSTKERRRLIKETFSEKLHAYLCGICKNHGIFVCAIGGADDHVHMLVQIPPVLPLAKAVAAIKSNSSRWARESGYHVAWQEGYGAFSVSASMIPSVVQYIAKQAEHHRKMNFADEFRALLRKHDIEFGSRFVLG